MRIAICENDLVAQKVLKEYLQSLMTEFNITDIGCYNTGEELLTAIQIGKRFDCYMLDVELDGISGTELAAIIKQQSTSAIIILTTSFSQYIAGAFGIKVDQYLLKPIKSSTLRSVFVSLNRTYISSHVQYCMHNGKMITVACSDIIYVEFYQSNMYLYTKEDCFSITIDAKTEKQRYVKKGFLKSHQGFYVNPQYISSIHHSAVSCSNGSKVPISFRERKGLLKGFTEYITASYSI